MKALFPRLLSSQLHKKRLNSKLNKPLFKEYKLKIILESQHIFYILLFLSKYRIFNKSKSDKEDCSISRRSPYSIMRLALLLTLKLSFPVQLILRHEDS